MNKTHKSCPVCSGKNYAVLKGYKRLEIHTPGKPIEIVHDVATGYPKFLCLNSDCGHCEDVNGVKNENIVKEVKRLKYKGETNELLKKIFNRFCEQNRFC